MGEPRVKARLVVVGLGRMGRLHAANLAGRVAGAELVGVVDAVSDVAREIGEEHGVAWSTSLDALDADGVVIAAPTALHADLVERAARLGLHVFCEKPLGFEVGAARRAVAAANGVALQVGFQRRFDPDWVELAARLRAGELGSLMVFRCSHRNASEPHAGASLGDVFVDVAIHDLDAARWLGGEVAGVHAWERSGAACVSLRFESGALGLIDVVRRAAYGFECTAELVGSRATARAGAGARVELLRDGRASGAVARDHAERHAAAYVGELHHFGEVIRGAEPRGATGEDAVAALTLALLARRSAAIGAPVSVAEGVAA